MTLCVLVVGACVCLPACMVTRLTIDAVRIATAIGTAASEPSWSGSECCVPTKPVLSRTDVSVGMAEVRKNVGACFDRHGAPGLVRVRVRVRGRTGRPDMVSVLAPMGTTPTGRCVASAVAKARFLKVSRDTTFNYAYRLRSPEQE